MRIHAATYIFLATIFIASSCTPSIYPGIYPRSIGPRMIQPVSTYDNVNALPPKPNFTQSYSHYAKSKVDSKFGAVVRIIEFEYDISDTLTITPRLTSGFDEGEMTGILTILLDQYELTYENPSPEIRSYVEEVSYESSYPRNQSQQVFQPARTDIVVNPDGSHSTVHRPSTVSTIQNAVQEKEMQVISKSQLYNSASYNLEEDDIPLMLRSSSLTYLVQLQNCYIKIMPSKEQFRVLKRMVAEYYEYKSDKNKRRK